MSRYLFANNEMLMLGAGILIIGAVLTSYSFSTYVEMQKLGERIDFETLDKNNQISTTEKYYKYMEYSDFLNDKLKKNKRIPLKRVACVYLDYAQHNAIEMYYLTKDKMPFDTTRTKFSTDNVKDLYNILDSYKSCKQSAQYKAELEEILKDAQNFNKQRMEADERLEEFLYGGDDELPQAIDVPNENIPQTTLEPPTPQESIQPQTPNYIDSEGRAQTLTPEQIEYINKQQEKHRTEEIPQ